MFNVHISKSCVDDVNFKSEFDNILKSIPSDHISIESDREHMIIRVDGSLFARCRTFENNECEIQQGNVVARKLDIAMGGELATIPAFVLQSTKQPEHLIWKYVSKGSVLVTRYRNNASHLYHHRRNKKGLKLKNALQQKSRIRWLRKWLITLLVLDNDDHKQNVWDDGVRLDLDHAWQALSSESCSTFHDFQGCDTVSTEQIQLAKLLTDTTTKGDIVLLRSWLAKIPEKIIRESCLNSNFLRTEDELLERITAKTCKVARLIKKCLDLEGATPTPIAILKYIIKKWE